MVYGNWKTTKKKALEAEVVASTWVNIDDVHRVIPLSLKDLMEG